MAIVARCERFSDVIKDFPSRVVRPVLARSWQELSYPSRCPVAASPPRRDWCNSWTLGVGSPIDRGIPTSAASGNVLPCWWRDSEPAVGDDCRCWVPEAGPRLRRFVTRRCRTGPPGSPASTSVNLRRHQQHSAREGACRKRPKRADHDWFAEPITARTYGARSCGMDALSSADGSTGSAEPVEELAGRMRATGAGARSLCARWLSLSGAAFAGERR